MNTHQLLPLVEMVYKHALTHPHWTQFKTGDEIWRYTWIIKIIDDTPKDDLWRQYRRLFWDQRRWVDEQVLKKLQNYAGLNPGTIDTLENL